MAPQGYMITVYRITNIFYKYRRPRCTNFVRICIVSNPVLLLDFIFGSVWTSGTGHVIPITARREPDVQEERT